ncbi:DUF423 domain-containing protein [Thaumasiovibrio sp. DFM-14]|uniref:DUF423 domain-containing protein n=1 Tax=Thaumasiovibrio sp. DFM-14 TaxID=3384792 RepID=UPI0039A31BB3
MKGILLFAAFSGALGVGLGAFAAHGLKAVLSPAMVAVFQTGVHYQLIHTLALLAVAILMRFLPATTLLYAAIFFIVGIVAFSGSLYLLALTGIKWFGPITPFGGICFIVGWIALFIAVWRHA